MTLLKKRASFSRFVMNVRDLRVMNVRDLSCLVRGTRTKRKTASAVLHLPPNMK